KVMIKPCARAIGQCMRNNPIGIVIPCHRVIASNGTLGGFSGGKEKKPLEMKRKMLEFEGVEFKGGKVRK
ncbi:MAG TPA: MGMT family protein, partial [Firmicutes bacterium]|nr:MGMT family protein [Bacillota bacterium]